MTELEQEYNYTPLAKPLRMTEHNWPEGTVPLVSICCITYNHVNFIRDAIEGFLMQETTFPVEILIHDDASTDGTKDIIQDYCEKFPSLIRAYIQPENTYSKPNRRSYRREFDSMIMGKYVAICEGDDYWLTSYKLEKQIDFLERHPDVSLCFHNSVIYNKYVGSAGLFLDNGENSWHDIYDVINKNFIPTAAKVFRRSANKNIIIPNSIKAGDWISNLVLAEQGRVYYLHDVMSVYRIHDGGVWSSIGDEDKVNQEILLLQFVKTIFNKKYYAAIDRAIKSRLYRISLLGTLERNFINYLKKIYRNIYK